jgi:hypothetical protein
MRLTDTMRPLWPSVMHKGTRARYDDGPPVSPHSGLISPDSRKAWLTAMPIPQRSSDHLSPRPTLSFCIYSKGTHHIYLDMT